MRICFKPLRKSFKNKMPETNSKNSVGVNRPIQIIPSVLPADWANMGACVKNLEEAGVVETGQGLTLL